MHQIAPELWVSQADLFLFRLRTLGSLWTFRVPLEVLRVLDATGSMTPQALFDAYRAHIYAAAARLAETGDPKRQQTITSLEIKQTSAA